MENCAKGFQNIHVICEMCVFQMLPWIVFKLYFTEFQKEKVESINYEYITAWGLTNETI